MNANTAKVPGFAISQEILTGADKVIERNCAKAEARGAINSPAMLASRTAAAPTAR